MFLEENVLKLKVSPKELRAWAAGLLDLAAMCEKQIEEKDLKGAGYFLELTKNLSLKLDWTPEMVAGRLINN